MSGGMEDATAIGDMSGKITTAAFELFQALGRNGGKNADPFKVANAAMKLRRAMDDGDLGHRGDRIDVVQEANKVLLPRYRIRLAEEWPRTYVLEHRVQTEVWE